MSWMWQDELDDFESVHTGFLEETFKAHAIGVPPALLVEADGTVGMHSNVAKQDDADECVEEFYDVEDFTVRLSNQPKTAEAAPSRRTYLLSDSGEMRTLGSLDSGETTALSSIGLTSVAMSDFAST
ncbi:MAG: hypothetical protein MHM6MM_006815 [Cercozoa sp. M6MM]